MKATQYKRLLLVLVLPLLALGVWLASNETLFKRDFKMECGRQSGEFFCASVGATKQEVMSEYFRQRGVSFIHNIRLYEGVTETVTILSNQEREAYDLPALEYELADKAGRTTTLQVGVFTGSNTLEGPCLLGPYKNKGADDLWMLTCDGQQDWLVFKFTDPKVGAAYAQMHKEAWSERSKLMTHTKLTYALSIFLPLVIFLLTSLSIYLLLKMASFIRHGRANLPIK